jgi:hypothetical protein
VDAVSLNLAPYPAYNVLSGLLLVALGAGIAWLGRARRSNLALAIFSGSFGLGWTLNYAFNGDDPLAGPALVLFGALEVIAAGALVAVARSFPQPLAPGEQGVHVLPAAVAALSFVASIVLGLATGAGSVLGQEAQLVPPVFSNAVRSALAAGFAFALLLLALRYARTASAKLRHQQLLMSAALTLYPGFVAGEYLLVELPGYGRGIASLLVLGVLAVLWLRNARDAPEGASRAPRNLALLVLAMPTLAIALTAAMGTGFVGRGPPPATARVLTVAVLAYAILKHQLLGLDVKVKWTLTRGTLAGIFIAVFLVTTQVAQNYLSGYGPLVGGVAAGLLLFALTPLQRVAERVANVAMPSVKSVGEMAHPERASAYRQQAVVAWADGNVDRRDRAFLEALRNSLGLSHEEAARLESEAAASQPAAAGSASSSARTRRAPRA